MICEKIYCMYCIYCRGANGTARAPKPGKTPIMAARRGCRRRLLFFKIEVRPRSCRSYHIWRPWARCKFIKVQFNQSNEIKWPFWSFLTKVMKSSGHIGPWFVLVNSSHSHFDSTHFQHKERLSRTEQSYIFNTLEIKTKGLDSRIWDVEVGGLKNHNFLPWGCSSNLIGSAKGFLRLLRNFYYIPLFNKSTFTSHF